MLGQLRTHAKSWLTKFILGAMAVGLIFYFGYTGLKESQTSSNPSLQVIARVNGERITLGSFEQLYGSKIKNFGFTPETIPPSAREMIRQNILKQLIETKLFAEQAKKIGLTISDKELAETITSVPMLHTSGVFNKKGYLEIFKPSFERETGEDFEKTLREELLAGKFEDFIRDSVSVTDEEVKKEYLLSKTELNLQKISFNSPESSPAKDFKSIQTEIFNALKEKTPKASRLLETLKKKQGFKIEETGLHPLKDKVIFVGGDLQATAALECIIKLSPENPVCPDSYPVGSQKVFFKLLGKKEADLTKFEAEKTALTQSLLSRRRIIILKTIADALTEQARIDTYLNKI